MLTMVLRQGRNDIEEATGMIVLEAELAPVEGWQHRCGHPYPALCTCCRNWRRRQNHTPETIREARERVNASLCEDCLQRRMFAIGEAAESLGLGATHSEAIDL